MKSFTSVNIQIHNITYMLKQTICLYYYTRKYKTSNQAKEILTTYKQLEKQILCNRYYKRAT